MVRESWTFQKSSQMHRYIRIGPFEKKNFSILESRTTQRGSEMGSKYSKHSVGDLKLFRVTFLSTLLRQLSTGALLQTFGNYLKKKKKKNSSDLDSAARNLRLIKNRTIQGDMVSKTFESPTYSAGTIPGSQYLLYKFKE